MDDDKGGDWLIGPCDPPELTDIIGIDKELIAHALLSWLADRVSSALNLSSSSLLLTVVTAEYFGAYPCLAMKGSLDSIQDPAKLESDIHTEIKYQLNNSSVMDFLRFLKTYHPPDSTRW